MASSAGDTLRDSATGSSLSSEFTPTPSHTPLPASASSPTQSSKAITTATSTALEPGAEDHATMHFDDPPIPLHNHVESASNSASNFASNADSGPEKPLDVLYRATCRQKGQQDKIFYNDTHSRAYTGKASMTRGSGSQMKVLSQSSRLRLSYRAEMSAEDPATPKMITGQRSGMLQTFGKTSSPIS
jgi:hypothetical protein